MKKFILLFSFVVFSFAVFSQMYINAFVAQAGKWNGEEWEMFKAIECDIDMTLNDNLITVDDVAQSSYFTFEVISDDGNMVQWKAVDDKLVECAIVMSEQEGHKILVVIYTDRLYRYIYEIKE